MKKLLSIAVIAVSISSAIAGPIPLQKGETYRMRFSGDGSALPLHTSQPLKVIQIYDYPWIEVEFSWTPTVQIDENGKQVEPKTKYIRHYLNLNTVSSVTSSTQRKQNRKGEHGGSADGGG